MTLITENLNAATHWLPTELWGRTVVPVDMVGPALMSLGCTCLVLDPLEYAVCGSCGTTAEIVCRGGNGNGFQGPTYSCPDHYKCECHTLQGVRINDLSPMAPWNHFRAHMLKEGAKFVKSSGKLSLAYQPITSEHDMRVYGPYRSRTYTDVAAKRASGRKAGEIDHRTTVDFKIWGEFVQKYARVTDPGPERPDWAVKHWAEVDRDIAERDRAKQLLTQDPRLILAR